MTLPVKRPEHSRIVGISDEMRWGVLHLEEYAKVYQTLKPQEKHAFVGAALSLHDPRHLEQALGLKKYSLTRWLHRNQDIFIPRKLMQAHIGADLCRTKAISIAATVEIEDVPMDKRTKMVKDLADSAKMFEEQLREQAPDHGKPSEEDVLRRIRDKAARVRDAQVKREGVLIEQESDEPELTDEQIAERFRNASKVKHEPLIPMEPPPADDYYGEGEEEK